MADYIYSNFIYVVIILSLLTVFFIIFFVYAYVFVLKGTKKIDQNKLDKKLLSKLDSFKVPCYLIIGKKRNERMLILNKIMKYLKKKKYVVIYINAEKILLSCQKSKLSAEDIEKHIYFSLIKQAKQSLSKKYFLKSYFLNFEKKEDYNYPPNIWATNEFNKILSELYKKKYPGFFIIYNDVEQLSGKQIKNNSLNNTFENLLNFFVVKFRYDQTNASSNKFTMIINVGHIESSAVIKSLLQSQGIPINIADYFK